MDDITIAILLVTYKPDWIKFRRTLHSITIQKDVSFSLVIADDGSENDFFELAEDYLKASSFTDYRFIKNKDNEGTVKNILSGLKTISATYVKPISPGDFFYDEYTLSKLVTFLEANPCSACFGDVYSYIDGDFDSIRHLKQPFIVKPYTKHCIKNQKHFFFCHHDFINGVSLVYKTDRFVYWLSELSRIIKYTEDTTTIACMLSHDEVVKYMPLNDSGFVWYEIRVGISTSGNDEWVRIIDTEIKSVFYNKNYVSKNDLLVNYQKNKFVKIMVKLFFDTFYTVRRKFMKASQPIASRLDAKDVLKKIYEKA